jgi:DeoR family transcriptional regulator, copper-sensing transcriptional repressor
MQPLTDRQQKLVELLETQNHLSISSIQEHFGVSAATAYRDLHVLVFAGLAKKTSRGFKKASDPGNERIDEHCFYCGGTLNDRAEFVIQMRDGSQRRTCCAHCGLLALKHPGVQTALASDFLYGRMINVRQAIFIVESKVAPCCDPSVLCFANEEDAQHFQMGFEGQVCKLEEATSRLEQLMELK